MWDKRLTLEKVKYFHIKLKVKVTITLLIRKHQAIVKQPNLAVTTRTSIDGPLLETTSNLTAVGWEWTEVFFLM